MTCHAYSMSGAEVFSKTRRGGSERSCTDRLPDEGEEPRLASDARQQRGRRFGCLWGREFSRNPTDETLHQMSL